MPLKITLYIIISLLLHSEGFSQVENKVEPQYKHGSKKDMHQFIKNNVSYPNGVCIEGKVYTKVFIDSLGNITDVQIIRGIEEHANEEAISVIRLLEFIPGKINGIPKKMKIIIPVSFTIER